MSKIFVTRKIPDVGINLLKNSGHDVVVSEKDGVLTREELLAGLKKDSYDAVISLLTDKIDAEIFDAVPSAKIFANYAVGFNNIDLDAAKERGITITNTPGVLTDSVAEYAVAFILSLIKRIPEGDRFTRAGKYEGWAPELMLGADIKDSVVGILGAGRIGSKVAEILHSAFGVKVIYYDVKQNSELESKTNAEFKPSPLKVAEEADIISVHVPLLESTRHLIDEAFLSSMKNSAYLVNTSRGKVVDEKALYKALDKDQIKGAAIDVFEFEPDFTAGMEKLENIIMTPHIASGTVSTRGKMSEMAAQNIIDFLSGDTPKNIVV